MNKVYIFAFILLAMPALADNNKGFYLGIGASGIDDEQDVTLSNIDTTAIRVGEIIGGYKYNNALGAEIRIGQSVRVGEGIVKDPVVVATTGTIERDLESYQSIYYKPELVNDDAKLYALLGYTKTSSSLTKKNLNDEELSSESTSYSGMSYGVGIGFVINEHFNVNFEYKNICDDLYNSPNMSSVNIDYRF